ncbi:hypothetical protein HOD41_01630 [bacterium]|jgi:hypothetical protein|nr:hypothetical protein [bacterium]
MRNFALVLMMGALVFTLSCQEQTTLPVDSQVDELNASILFQPNLSLDNPEVQEYLAGVWESASHNQWDTVSGIVNLSEGGIVSGVPGTWPSGYEFSIKVPENCTAEYEDSFEPVPQIIELQIYVPKYIEGQPLAAVYKLQPDIIFNKPVNVTFHYPPWLAQDDEYIKYCLDIEETDPAFFSFSDLGILLSEETSINFKTTHFSLWKVRGSDDPDGD